MLTLNSNPLADQTIIDILHNLAHDIRSPISSLMAIAKDVPNIPPQYSTFIKHTLERMTEIIDTSLKQVRDNENNRLPLITETTLVDEVIQNIICEKQFEYKESNVEFVYNHNKDKNTAKILINKSNLARMLSNLFNNAVEACMDKDGIIITELVTDCDRVYIVIRDNGKGMPEEVKNKIMNNEVVTYGKYGVGQGIGFTQIRNTIFNNGGGLSIESIPDIETTIRIDFPIVFDNDISLTTSLIMDNL